MLDLGDRRLSEAVLVIALFFDPLTAGPLRLVAVA